MPPDTHDLEDLIDGLEKNGLSIPNNVVDADVLTTYAWEARYPGLSEPVSLEEYEEAVRQAETVLTWAEAECDRT